MKKTFSILLITLLSISFLSTFSVSVFAANTVKILPSSAYVGMFRTILVDVEAQDDAWGIWETGVWATNVPTGVYISFSPPYVRFSGAIKSTMLVHAGPSAMPGTYSVTVVAGWTTIIGQHWETSKTFTLEVRGVSEGYWALNPSLLLSAPPKPNSADKWYPRCTQWNWATGSYWEVQNEPNHYVKWNISGRVDMKATDTVVDTIDEVGDFTQGYPGFYQPPQTTMNPTAVQYTIRAAATNIGTNYPVNPISWTGIKFDATAVSKKDGRTLYIEMYFVRGGGNLDWSVLPPTGFRVHPSRYEAYKCGSNWDNYLVAIDVPDLDFNKYFTSIKVSGPTTWFAIDLSWYFEWAEDGYRVYFPDVWDSSRSINDYVLQRVGPCLEAHYGGAYDIFPQCMISFQNIEVKGSYLPDINLDGKVDMLDVSMVSACFGTKLGDTKYLPNADINIDGVIDMKDLSLTTSYFGKTFP